MFSTSFVDTVVRSCGRKVSSVCCGGNPRTQWWTLEVRDAPIEPDWPGGLLRQLTVLAGEAWGSTGSRGSKNSGLGKDWGGHGGGLPVSLEEILANHPAPQEGETVLHQHCLQWRCGAVDLDWGHCQALEGILCFSQMMWSCWLLRASMSWGGLQPTVKRLG